MTDETSKPRRVIDARRLTLGTLALATATAHAGLPDTAEAAAKLRVPADQAVSHLFLAAGEGEGEGEGEGRAVNAETALMRDLGFIEGHLRAGLALYRAGDVDAAKTHMGHPITEKYAAVAGPMADRGLSRLGQALAALAEAAEAGETMDEITARFDTVRDTIAEARAGATPAEQVAGLIALTRIAGDEYSVATTGGQIANLHEYQDSWGFLQVVAQEARALGESEDSRLARVGGRMVSALSATEAVFGDLQGQGKFELAPEVIYGVAARMELAAAGLSRP